MDKGERSDFLWNLPQRVFGGSYVQVGSAGDTSFLDTGLTANIEYYYKIMANDSVHKIESQFSAEVSAITMTVQPPALISPANGQPDNL